MLTFKLETLQDCKEMLIVVNRAANTWEPGNYPKWLMPLADRLEKIIAEKSRAPDKPA